MAKSAPRFAVMDGGNMRLLSDAAHADELRHKLFQALQDWREASVQDTTHPFWQEPGEAYVIVPTQEIKDHVLVMRDGLICKYAADQRAEGQTDFRNWLHLLNVMPDLPVKLAKRAEALSEDRIETLLDVMLDVDPFEPVEARIDAKNAEMRAEFLKDFPVLDSAAVHKRAGLKGSNTSQTVNGWRQKGRILGLPVTGKIAYPTFQFDADGQPYALMARVLAALPQSYTPWQRAFWCVSPKEDLDGHTPVRAIQGGDGRVVAVAQGAHDHVAG